MNEITKELLDALKDAEEALSHVENNLHVRVNPPTLGRMREAIAKAEAILAAPQPSADGWIPWAGGERPVDTGVVVKFRSGGIGAHHARNYDWRHVNDPVDIVAYQVEQQSEETWG